MPEIRGENNSIEQMVEEGSSKRKARFSTLPAIGGGVINVTNNTRIGNGEVAAGISCLRSASDPGRLSCKCGGS